jgi:release factor glutamine methyltransferase
VLQLAEALSVQAQYPDRRELVAVLRTLLTESYRLPLWVLVGRSVLPLEPSVVPQLQADLQALAAGKPVQYLTGQVSFCGVAVCCGPGVLIPRPETEELVAEVARRLPTRSQCIVDLCTGSGCILFGLHSFRDDVRDRLVGVDASPEALAYARQTQARHTPRFDDLHFVQADLFSLPLEAYTALDVVVANPPYVPQSERPSLHPNVREHEPEQALFVPNNDPLLFYRAIAGRARSWLRPGGLLAFEGHIDYCSAVALHLQTTGWQRVEVVPDLTNRPRFVLAYRP